MCESRNLKVSLVILRTPPPVVVVGSNEAAQLPVVLFTGTINILNTYLLFIHINLIKLKL